MPVTAPAAGRTAEIGTPSANNGIEGSKQPTDRNPDDLRSMVPEAPDRNSGDFLANNSYDKDRRKAGDLSKQLIDRANAGNQIIGETMDVTRQYDKMLKFDSAGKLDLSGPDAAITIESMGTLARKLEIFANNGVAGTDKDQLLGLSQNLYKAQKELQQIRDGSPVDAATRNELDGIKGQMDLAHSHIQGAFKTDVKTRCADLAKEFEAKRQLFADAQENIKGQASIQPMLSDAESAHVGAQRTVSLAGLKQEEMRYQTMIAGLYQMVSDVDNQRPGTDPSRN